MLCEFFKLSCWLLFAISQLCEEWVYNTTKFQVLHNCQCSDITNRKPYIRVLKYTARGSTRVVVCCNEKMQKQFKSNKYGKCLLLFDQILELEILYLAPGSLLFEV